MALIDLKLIGELLGEAHLNEFMIEGYMLGWDKRGKGLSDFTIVGIFKLHKQASTLSDNLVKLHRLCTDFAAGNLAAYMDEHEKYRENESDPAYNPLDALSYVFNSQCIYDLPVKIEQYKELVDYLPRYAKLKQIRREGFTRFFGDKIRQGYLVENGEGEAELIPESEMPEQVVTEIKANQQIREINVEYCLDHYNAFRATCLKLIDQHRLTGDYAGCAREILKMYAPWSPIRSKNL